jgi:hypothetical protein
MSRPVQFSSSTEDGPNGMFGLWDAILRQWQIERAKGKSHGALLIPFDQKYLNGVLPTSKVPYTSSTDDE